MIRKLQLPLSAADMEGLTAGDRVVLSGTALTARDRAHKYIINELIEGTPSDADRVVKERLAAYLAGGCVYHCGPVMRQNSDGTWHMVAGGPTTSIREEPYEAALIREFGVRCIVGKGGMGAATAAALHEYSAVYLHAVGGAAVVAARSVERVCDVLKLEFGMPEAIWVLELKDFPAIVTMDHKGGSIHNDIAAHSQAVVETLQRSI